MRLFVAVPVDDATRAAVAAAQACLRAGLAAGEVRGRRGARVTWVRPQAVHLTLQFLGEVDEPVAGAVREALVAPFGTPAFDVRWDTLGRFPDAGAPRTIWLGCSIGAPELCALHDEVVRRLSPLAPAADVRFHPHLTLARVKEAGPRDLPWGDVLRACPPAAVSCAVREVHLVLSRLSPAGPSYTSLTATPLA